MYYKKNFTPKKPVRTFRDLEIYQKTIECAVLIMRLGRGKVILSIEGN